MAFDWDFFLAHAGADVSEAEELYGYLKDHAKVYLDSQALLLGDSWDIKLPEAQRASLITLVLVSAKTEKAYYQREEIAAAIAMAREDETKHRVIPIYLDDPGQPNTDVPYGLRLKHGIRLSGNLNLRSTAEKLLEQLPKIKASIGAPTLLANAGFREAIEPKWLAWPKDQSWVLVINSEQPPVDLPDIAGAAVKKFNEDHKDGGAFSSQPVVAAIEDAVASPDRWLQLIRALCAAPVVIADVTKFQPAVMLALGVRAVVRRAVTITSTADDLNEGHLMNLPFNIQETKLICHGTPEDASTDAVTVIAESMSDGLLEFGANSRYLDLPAYDAVRCPVPKLPATQRSVLVLCPFHPDYTNWKALKGSIHRRCSPRKPKRMLDIGSPRLVGQALYEAIRFTDTCIVDWSMWRPNVFFELGVRLACSKKGPISLIDSDAADPPWPVQAKQLRALFRPTSYNRKSPSEALNKAWEAHEKEIAGDTSGLPSSGLTHDATYQLATASFEWETDESIIEPQNLLRASVEESIGKDPQQLGMPAVLFSKGAFQKRIESSARERWIAAWYYLRYRYADDLKGNDDLVREFERVGENLLSSIPPDTQDSYLSGLKEEVIACLGTLKAPATSSEAPNVSDRILDLKTQAKNRRDDKRYDLAVPILENAISVAKAHLDNPGMQNSMAEQLADCYGLLGGVERRWALSTNSAADRDTHLRKSIKAYDEAWNKFESGDYGLKTSYGMMNRLVSRLLLKPASLDEQAESEFGEGVTPLAVRQALGDARGLIESQLKLRDDWWAAADLALAKLLLREGDPARAYAGFLEKSPPDYALKSVLDILQPLADLSWPLASALTQAKAVIEAAAKKLATAE